MIYSIYYTLVTMQQEEKEFNKLKQEVEPLNILKTDTDILPKKQRYAVITFITPHKSAQQLFYAYAFNLFIKYGQSPIKKFMFDSNVEYNKNVMRYIHEEANKFFATTIKKYEENEAKIEENAIANDKIVMEERIKIAEQTLSKLAKLPDDIVFTNPKLKEYVMYVTKYGYDNEMINIILSALESDVQKMLKNKEIFMEVRKLYSELKSLNISDTEINLSLKNYRDYNAKVKAITLENDKITFNMNHLKRQAEADFKENHEKRLKEINDRKAGIIEGFYAKLHLEVEAKNSIKYEKDEQYIEHYFQVFIDTNRKIIEEEFQKKYTTNYQGMYELWAVFETPEQCQEFIDTHRKRMESFGNTYIQEMGCKQIFDPKTKEDVKYMNKRMNEMMTGFKKNIEEAREQMMYRKEVLKEKEMRDRKIEMVTYSKDQESLSKQVNPENLMQRKLKDVDMKIINRDFEFFNPKDHMSLKIPEYSMVDKNKEIVKDLINTELKIGTPGILNPEMLDKMKYSKEDINRVEDEKTKLKIKMQNDNKDYILHPERKPDA